ncbi:hypothetical protein H2200_007851 [Cladophialophora chaetospira]|uniref:RING-type domain-containing protein n=1 Tax=Cladophialophora chaetospira TaxID=386627 RepID=A0AA38X6N6_9EURO|nr:hypothetical protein H2200_007851 [Cladophialophora chaetospira]
MRQLTLSGDTLTSSSDTGDRTMILVFDHHPSGFINLYELEILIEDFVAQELPSLAVLQRPRAVELFAESLPLGLVFEELSDLGKIFAECIERSGLSADLLHVFYYNMPPAAEICDEDEDEENVEMVEDVSAVPCNGHPIPEQKVPEVMETDPQPTLLPSWFNNEDKCDGCGQGALFRYYESEVKASTHFNEIYDLRMDLCLVLNELMHFNWALWQRISFFEFLSTQDWAPARSPLRTEALGLVEESETVSNQVFNLLYPDNSLSWKKISDIRKALVAAEEGLLLITERCLKAEAYLATREPKFWGVSMSDYIWAIDHRAQRAHLRGILSRLRTPRLRAVFLPNSAPVQTSRPHKEEDCCSICMEAFPEGEGVRPLAVSYECCEKPFHPGCILEWLLTQAAPVTCPMCRYPVSLALLREVMEMQLREEEQAKDLLPQARL